MQSLPSSEAPSVHGVPGPEQFTVLCPSPSFHETETGRAVTVDQTRPLLAVAVYKCHQERSSQSHVGTCTKSLPLSEGLVRIAGGEIPIDAKASRARASGSTNPPSGVA